jgi:hypothetical protein
LSKQKKEFEKKKENFQTKKPVWGMDICFCEVFKYCLKLMKVRRIFGKNGEVVEKNLEKTGLEVLTIPSTFVCVYV